MYIFRLICHANTKKQEVVVCGSFTLSGSHSLAVNKFNKVGACVLLLTPKQCEVIFFFLRQLLTYSSYELN